jgi:hypothetical protein
MTETFKPFELVKTPEKVLELMMNGYFLKRFQGENADYWSLMNDVVKQTPHVIPVDTNLIPHDQIVLSKETILKDWVFPGMKPIVTTYKIKE